MQVIRKNIKLSEIKDLAAKMFGNLIKAVIDIDQEIIALDAELHSDLEALLLSEGSKQENLWGINIYPELAGDDFIEFDSLINLRPYQQNRSRSVEDPEIRKRIIQITNKLINR